jgi:hypothetical protein
MSMVQVRTHPVVAAAAAVTEALTSVAGVDPVFMTPVEKEQALRSLDAAQGQVHELQARVLAAADDLAERDAARDPAAGAKPTTPANPGPPAAAPTSSTPSSAPSTTTAPTTTTTSSADTAPPSPSTGKT